jgi:hypothetical protein
MATHAFRCRLPIDKQRCWTVYLEKSGHSAVFGWINMRGHTSRGCWAVQGRDPQHAPYRREMGISDENMIVCTARGRKGSDSDSVWRSTTCNEARNGQNDDLIQPFRFSSLVLLPFSCLAPSFPFVVRSNELSVFFPFHSSHR